MAKTPDEPIRDPKRLRALAHPLRWRLIELIDDEDSATATRCSEALGESVASCSYHLNILAKYDFVEEVPSEGREKPWRLTRRSQTFGSHDLSSDAQLASEEAGEAFLEFEFAGLRERMRSYSREPDEWREITRMMATTVWVTSAELSALAEGLTELMERFEDRSADAALRPEGARAVRLFGTMFPKPDRR